MKNILSAIAMIAWSGYALAGDYTVAQLGLLPGGTFTEAAAINNAGVVVGFADTVKSPVGQLGAAAEWNGTTPTVLALSLGAIGVNGINNSGVIVGNDGGRFPSPVVWIDGVERFLQPMFGYATGINDSGEIVGDAVFPSPASPILWTSPTAASVTLPTLEGPNPSSFAVAINASGQIVGYSITTTNPTDGTFNIYHATLWTGPNGADVSDLGTLGGTNGAAAAINASDRIVGWADTESGDQHAAFWHHKKVKDLGTLGGNTSSANAINAAGYIVGSADTLTGDLHAVLWMHARSKPVDLNSEIDSSLAQNVTLTDAVGINDKCQIAVNGIDNRTGASESFVLSLRHDSKCPRCERSDDDWKAQSDQHGDSKDNDCERGGGDN